MDFKEIHFDSEEVMMSFIDRHWHRVFNIRYVNDPDPGELSGWVVRVVQPLRSD